jgi:hypothetical protein
MRKLVAAISFGLAMLLCTDCVQKRAGQPAQLATDPLPIEGQHMHPNREMDWPTFRHDPQRTGRAGGAGKIRNPVIAWRHPIGGRRALLEISAHAGTAQLAVPFSQEIAPEQFRPAIEAWDGAGRLLDLAGDGKSVQVRESANVRYAQFLPGARGWQKFVMEDGMAVKKRPDGPHRPVATGALYRYDRSREELVWQTAPEEQCEVPLCAVADMDGDGALEIAVATWWRVMVFAGATGKKKMECRWHDGRNYGHFQVVNLAGEPFPKCVVLADFMIHLDVLDNNGRQLTLRWRKEIDARLFQKRKAVRVGPRPIVSLRGEREKEIALNVYNAAGDNRWHVMVFDLPSGQPLADRPDRYLHGTAGADTLLLSEAHGLATPVAGSLFAARWRDGGLGETALPVAGRWLTFAETHLPQTQASCAADGNRTVVVTDLTGNGSKEAWLVSAENSLVAFELNAWREAARCRLPAGTRASVAAVPEGAGRFLLELDSPTGRDASLALAGVQGAVRSVTALPLPPDVPVVGRLEPGRPPVIALAAAGDVIALAGSPPRELWRAPGRAQTTDMVTFMGLELADVNSDGRWEELAATQAQDGRAELVAYDAKGQAAWSHLFARFSGDAPVWNTGGLLLWTADGANVLAMLRRAAMHTDESCMLEGRTGRELWWQDNLVERGCGGAPVALRDGDIVGLYPDISFVLAGATGKPLAAAPFPHEEFGGMPYYAMPTLLDTDGDGKPETLMGRCLYALALFGRDGKLRWHGKFLDGTTSAPAVADLNADGRLAVGAMAYRGGFGCYDAATGAVRWTFGAAQASTDPVAADINGDGRDEFIVAIGNELLAIGEEAGQARVAWRLALPAAANSPVAADIDGDGKLEILCAAADGCLYCLRNAD